MVETLAAYYQRNKAWAKPGPYLTKLSKKEEKAFQKWAEENKVPWQESETSDYDMRGFFKALINKDPRAMTAINPNDNLMHFPDVWKTPYHHSFSAESQYATKQAPNWNPADQLVTPAGVVTFDERTKPTPAPVMGAPLTLGGQYGVNAGDQMRQIKIPTSPGVY